MAKGDRIGNRKTREQRRTIKVPELGYYLIVTDTEGTERCFFTGLHQSLPEEVKNKLVIKVVETKTRSMIDKCLELTAYEAQYRIPWIVFDRDQVIGFDEIISEAEKKGIQVGWSNPCFEIWMYTYFGAMPAIQDSWTCCSEFGRVYESKTGQKYSKADEKMYGKISNAGNEEKAIQIAQQKLEQCEREGNNDNCYIYTGEKQYSGTGRNARQTNIVREFNAYSFLPIKLNVTEVVGERIDICCSSPYRDFFTNTRTCYYYASYFSVAENSTILGKIKGTDKVVAAVIPYGSGKIVLLPQIYEEEEYKTEDVWKENGKKYLDSLFELNRRLKITDEEMDLPGWAQNIYILDEKVKLKKQNTIENKIAKLEKELDKERIAVQEVQKYKLLLTSSGTTLEEIVKQVLDELGFTILEAEKGRSDIIAKYGEVAIVAEIKGVTKSAAEKHAAQLEKWVAQYIEENEVSPKGMLIVNGFCDMPLNERLEDVFPQQMLKYCVSRGHVLLTSTQLLCLYIEVCKNPICKEERITELLSCVGKYERYREIKDYLK